MILYMNKILLGSSDLKVSQLGLGCISFGTSVVKTQAFKIMDTYVELGGNFFDTANNYSFWEDNGSGGESEKVIGQWLNSRGKRDQMIIATKIGALPNQDGPQDFTNMQGNSREVLFKEVDRCLERLQTTYIDLLYLHIDDRETALEESMLALSDLKKSGKIRAYGASNFKTWRLEQARNICYKHNIDYFVAIEQRFSYLSPISDYNSGVQQFVNDEFIDYLNTYRDFTLVAYSIMLEGQYKNNDIINEGYDTKVNRDKLTALTKKQDKPGLWVLNWVCKQFNGSVALVTTSSIEHLKENIEYINSNN